LQFKNFTWEVKNFFHRGGDIANGYMKRRKSDTLIPSYHDAIRLMRDGTYDLSVPIDHNDAVGKLGHELNDLAQNLERKFSEAIKLQEISDEVTSGLFLNDVLVRMYNSFRPIIPYNRIGYALLNDDKTEAVAYWAKTDVSNASLKIGYTGAMAGSSLQQIIETGQPRILNDLEYYLIEHPESANTKMIVEEGMRSSLTCPLITEGKPVGFLFFSSNEKNTYKDIHQDIFLKIARQISALLEKSRLYQQLYELNQKLLLAQAELQHQATHDALSGLYNRRAIMGHLEAQLARAKREKQPLGVVLLDLDHFKKINDTYGHLAGDAVIIAVSARMKNCLREYDYIGRYGGEEFLVALGNTDYETAIKTAERLMHVVIDKAVIFEGNPLVVTISAGVAVAENCNGLNPDTIISVADAELYKAKANGRNRVEACRI
jgi:diguanylate cyclase (GGDEF)-like protein